MQDASGQSMAGTRVDDCGCEPRIEGHRLVVDAIDCPEEGRLAASPACRASVVGALVGRPIARVRTRIETGAYVHSDGATALLVAAGRFVALAAGHDRALAARALGDPLSAARVAAGRSGPVAEFAAATRDDALGRVSVGEVAAAPLRNLRPQLG